MSDELWFRFHPSKFMAGIRGLNANEVKVYICLLCRMYEKSGPLKNDREILGTYCEMRPSSFDKALARLIRLEKIILTDDGLLTNPTAEREISQRASKSKIASRAGKKSAEKRQQKQDPAAASVQQSLNHKRREEVEKEEADASSKKPSPRGTRLPDQWVLPRDWGEWALSEGFPEETIRTEAAKFRDYWIGKAGADARKVDWQATFRNWMRNSRAPRRHLTPIDGGENARPNQSRQGAGGRHGWREPSDPDHPQLRGILDAAAAVAARGNDHGRG